MAPGWVQTGATTTTLLCGYNPALGGMTVASPPNAAALECTNGVWAVAGATSSPFGAAPQPATCVADSGR